MKMKSDKNHLALLINQAKTLNSSRSSHDLYSKILLEAHDHSLTIRATDGNMSFEVVTSVHVDEKGKTLVSCENLSDILRYLNTSEVNLHNEESSLYIETISNDTQRSRMQLRSIDPEQFIWPIEDTTQKESLHLSAKDLLYLIDQCSLAVSQEEHRPAMRGLFFNIEAQKISVVATNGHRLSMAWNEGTYLQSSFRPLIPASFAQILRSLLNGEGLVELRFDQRRVYVKFGEYRLSCGLINADFPDYQAVLPQKQLHQVKLSKEKLSSALRLVSVLSDRHTKRVFFDFTSNQLQLRSEHTESGLGETLLEIEYQGNQQTLALNSDYILDALKVLGDEVYLDFNDEKSPISLREKEGHSLHIVMPMYLNEN